MRTLMPGFMRPRDWDMGQWGFLCNVVPWMRSRPPFGILVPMYRMLYYSP